MTTNLRQQILNNRKVLSHKEYRKWLENKLLEYGITGTQLVATVIVVERTLGAELARIGNNRNHIYYELFKDNGKPTRAWIYAAELTLWLKYNKFKANPYIQAIVTHPLVRRRVMNPTKKQIPLNVLFPVTRLNTVRLKEYSKHFRNWLDRRG